MTEPLTLADNLELMRPNAHGRIVLALEKSQLKEVVAALRLAANTSPDPDAMNERRAAEEMYLVWSNQHRAWWRANSHGYTDNVKSAGRYSRAEAISISFQGRDGWDSPKGVPDELAIAECDVPVFTASTTGEPKR